MSEIPLNYLPGVCKVDSAYANSIKGGAGRITDMDKMRFVAGKPERIFGDGSNGDAPVIGGANTFIGQSRAIKSWNDNSSVGYVANATDWKLYVESATNGWTDVSPARWILISTLTNPLTTTSGSSLVSVAHTSHGLQKGDAVQLVAGAAIDGITLNGNYIASTITDANNYKVDSGVTATGSTSGGGGTVNYKYNRVTLSGPFTTTSGSAVVTVAHTAHGANTNDYVAINGASAVAGLTLSGPYQLTVVNANSYTITASSNANASTSGGGSPNFIYDVKPSTSGNNIRNFGNTANRGVIWCLDRYGQQLLMNTPGQTIYVFDPVNQANGSGSWGRAYPLFNAPSSVYGMFVTPERYVFALGASGIPMQLAWPDQNDYTAWTPSATNTANSGRTLQYGVRLMNGIGVRDGVSLFWSDTTAYTATYTGDSFIYQTVPVGFNCGLAFPNCFVVMNNIVYWMGITDFWMWNGTVQPIPSDDIRDYVFGNLRTLNCTGGNAFVGANSVKKEIWFIYASSQDGGPNNPTRYAIYHTDQNCWSCGTITATSWEDISVVHSTPYFGAQNLSGNNRVFQLDNATGGWVSLGNDVPSLTFSPMDISHGDKNMDIVSFIPDFQRLTGNIWNLYITTQTYPMDTVSTSGPYALGTGNTTPRIDLRVGAKLAGWQISGTSTAVSQNSPDFRLGLPRVEAQPAGARR